MITFTRCAFMAKQACATFSQVVQKITPPIANNFLKFFFVLFAILTLNAATAWAEEATYTLNASNNGNTVKTGEVQWTIDASAIESSSSNCKLTGKITVSLPSGAILNKVTITKGSTWGTGATVTFAAGSTTLYTFSSSGDYTLTSNKNNCTYTFTKSGTANKNAWVKSISVDYSISLSTPATITLSEAGVESSITGKNVGEQYELPSTSSQTCGTKTFVGWSTKIIENSPTKPTAATYFEPDASVTLGATNTFYAVFAETGGTPTTSWSKTDIANIKSTDEVAITMSKGEFMWALSSSKGTDAAPDAILVEQGNLEFAGALLWNIQNDEGDLTIYPNGTSSKWLYCTNTNNGVRVGTNTNKTFTISGNYLKHTATSRYVGVYITTSPDWRCYTSTTGNSNIAGQTLAFYKKTTTSGYKNYTTECVAPCTDPDLAYATASVAKTVGDAAFTNPLTNNKNVSVTYTSTNTSVATVAGNGQVTILAAGTTTIKATWEGDVTYCEDEASYTLTVNPKTYTIIVANNISNGSVSADKSSAVEGATIKLTATPNTGYKLGTWNVKDASNNPVSVNENGEFTMPASNVTVSATFVSLPKLATPSNLSATEINPTSATLNWKWLENTYDAQLSYYYLYIKKEGDANFTGPITYNSTSCSRTNLEPNTNYIWKVQAISKDKTIVLTSEESTPSYFTTKALPTYTVSFSTGTGNPTQEDIKETEGGAGIKLPAGPDPLCPDWTFAGWAEADVTEPTTEPTLFAEGTNYKPADNCTLYAVYSKTEENGGGTDYQLVTSEPTDWSGTYLIVNTEDAKVWKGSATSDNGAIDVTITSNTIKSDETTDKEIFTIAPMTGGYSIKGASGEYISGTSDKNETNYGTSAALNTISIDEDNNVKITSNTSVLRQNNTSKNLFRYYKSSSYSTQHPIQLYKKGTGSSITTFSSNPDCTPPAEYTITWWANGEEFYTQTDVEGTTIEVPASSDVATYACDDKVFVGWVDAEIIGSTNIEPTFITDFDKITGDRDFYAVFATEENNDESIFAVGKSGDFKIYALVEGANIYATAYDNGKLGSTSDENSAVIYTFTHKGENQYTIYNGSKYIAYGTSGTDLKTQSDEYLWKIAPATNGKGSWRITSVSTTKRAIIYNTSNYFKAYATSNITTTGYYDIEIGSVPTTTYSGYVTTCEKPTYTRVVKPGEYGTICLPYGSSDYTGAEFYEVSSVEYGKGLWLDQLAAGTALAAGKPYIFRATAEKLAVVYKGEKKDSPVDGVNGLTGTFTDIAANSTLVGHYIIALNQIWVANDKNTLPAYRAYINADVVPTTAQA